MKYGSRCVSAAVKYGSEEYYRCVRQWAEGDLQAATPKPYTIASPTPEPNSLEARLTRAYGERCKLAGYEPGTGAFGQCLLAYSDREEDFRRAVAAQLLANQLNRPPLQPYQVQPYQLPLPRLNQATCTSIINNQIVTTTCR
jgi:hypothetical protein